VRVPDSAEFFGRGVNAFFRQNFNPGHRSLLMVMRAFKPIKLEVPVLHRNFNINYFNTQENGVVKH